MHSRNRNVFFLLLILAPAVHAGVLYKCSDPKGAVTIQSDPCPKGATEVWKRDSAPAPQQTLQQVVANSAAQRSSGAVAPTAPVASAPRPPSPPGAPAAPPPGAPMPPTAPTPPAIATPPPAAAAPPPASTPSTIALQWHDEPETPAGQPAPNNACDSAKAFASSVREKIWLDLTQEQSQRLYGWVLDQCGQH